MLDELQPSYGLHRLDHAVGNAPKMQPVLQYLTQMTGWHHFAEFTAEDVGTLDSGTCMQEHPCAPAMKPPFDWQIGHAQGCKHKILFAMIRTMFQMRAV